MSGSRQHPEADAGGQGSQRRPAWPAARRMVLHALGVSCAPGQLDADFLERDPAQPGRSLAARPAFGPGAEAALADVRADAVPAAGPASRLDAGAAAVAVAGGAVRRSVRELLRPADRGGSGAGPVA